MRTLWQDLRFGARMLMKKPGFAVLAILTLAIGIGGNTAIFSVVNAVLLRPLPYAEPDRLVAMGETDPRHLPVKDSTSYPNFFDWRERNRSFEQIAVYHGSGFTMTGAREPAHLNGQVVSAEIFDLLGAKPYLGRVFTRAEEKVGAGGVSRAAIISYELWRQRFASDPGVIGRAITLDRKQFEIVGVMKAGFQFPIQAEPVEIWVTPAIDSEAVDGKKPLTERRGYRLLEAVGRLKPGVSLDQARTEMKTLSANLEKEHPDQNTNRAAIIFPLHQDLVGNYRQSLLVLFAAVGCVLLIACANVANLMLSRATARYREIAVRAALGASRLRIIRQLLVESILLSVLGGLVGLLFAWWGMEALIRFIPEGLPRLSEIAIDRWTLGFSFAASILTGIFFGVAPAWQSSRVDLVEAIKDGARGAGSSPGKARLRGTLVIAETAIALTLLISASLLVQSFLKLQRLDLGFDPGNMLSASIELPDVHYAEPQQKIEFFERLLERVRVLPGVVSATAILPLPLAGNDVQGSFQIEGRPEAKGEELETQLRWITFDYLKTMKIPLIAGRDFNAQDNLRSKTVVLVNESLVQKYFPQENPIGKRLNLPFGVASDKTLAEIVGVVKNVKHRAELGRESGPELYISYHQLPFLGQMSLVVRSNVDSHSLSQPIQAEVAAIDKEIVINEVKTLDQYLGAAVAQPRFSALLLGLFGLVALLLSAVGLFSVMAYTVTRRTNEIGVRMALGAQTRDILLMTLRQGMSLALTGVVIGLLGAWGAAKWLSTLLYGVKPTDTLTFALITVMLLVVAFLACLIPARRASKVEPMVALRYE